MLLLIDDQASTDALSRAIGGDGKCLLPASCVLLPIERARTRLFIARVDQTDAALLWVLAWGHLYEEAEYNSEWEYPPRLLPAAPGEAYLWFQLDSNLRDLQEPPVFPRTALDLGQADLASTIRTSGIAAIAELTAQCLRSALGAFPRLSGDLLGGSVLGQLAAEMMDQSAVAHELAWRVARRGQGPFRDALLQAYEHRCCITGVGIENVLEAAHIIPAANGGLAVVENGLLLRSDLHVLFDDGLLAIVPETHRIWVSDRLAGSPYEGLAREPIRLRSPVCGAGPRRDALEWRWRSRV